MGLVVARERSVTVKPDDGWSMNLLVGFVVVLVVVVLVVVVAVEL